jgi:hypothetical protein
LFPLENSSRTGYCINGSRIAISVLTRLGITARPVSVTLAVFNQQAADLWLNDVPMDEWPAHAHSIGVGFPDDPAPGGWKGHLVVEGDDWTMDVSAEVLDRPGLIISKGAVVFPGKLDYEEGVPTAWHDQHHQLWVFQRTPANNTWRNARGWKLSDHNLEAIQYMLEKLS